jgi:hypothetical protein
MPFEVGVISRVAAGIPGFRRVGALLNPPVHVDTLFDGRCVVFRDETGHTVVVVERPCVISSTADLDCDDEGRVWTVGYVPFGMAQQGWDVMVAIAEATGGRVITAGGS